MSERNGCTTCLGCAASLLLLMVLLLFWAVAVSPSSAPNTDVAPDVILWEEP